MERKEHLSKRNKMEKKKLNNLRPEGITHNIPSRNDRATLSEKVYVVDCLGFHSGVELGLHDVSLARCCLVQSIQ